MARKAASPTAEDDPEILARIKKLEYGKVGYTQKDMSKVKYLSNIDTSGN